MILKVVLNYLILLIYGVVLGFRGGVIDFILPVILMFLSWINYHRSDKWQTVLILHIHLMISTVLGIFLGGYLFTKYISNDAETYMILMLMLMVGMVMVVGLGILTILIKYHSTKKS